MVHLILCLFMVRLLKGFSKRLIYRKTFMKNLIKKSILASCLLCTLCTVTSYTYAESENTIHEHPSLKDDLWYIFLGQTPEQRLAKKLKITTRAVRCHESSSDNQSFAKKCYENMKQFEKDYPKVPHKKIDAIIQEHKTLIVRDDPELAKKDTTDPITESNVYTAGEYNGGTIYLHSVAYEKYIQYCGTTEIRDARLKSTICHETGHAKLGHYATVREYISGPQKEFEAQTITALTLNNLNEQSAITEDAVNMSTLFANVQGHERLDSYLLGIINGIHKAGNKELLVKTLQKFKQKKKQYISYKNNKKASQSKTGYILLKNWQKSVDTFEEAQQQANAILKEHQKEHEKKHASLKYRFKKEALPIIAVLAIPVTFFTGHKIAGNI